jgi:hypothetical protein
MAGTTTLARWEDFFKAETRNAGEKLFAKAAVFIASASDTHIQASVRTSTPARVTFKTQSISEPIFFADCTCKKDFCKHIWATLIAVDEKYPDFLEAKTSIERSEKTPAATDDPPSAAKQEAAAKAQARADEFKQKQSEYRKLQYRLQKERLTKTKLQKKRAPAARSYPLDVEKALRFFSDNGFAFEGSIDEEELSNARKKLARIFHPDKGGSHDEALLLNENYRIIEEFLITQK